MNKSLLTIAGVIATVSILVACGNNQAPSNHTIPSGAADAKETPAAAAADPSEYDPNRGEGKFNDGNLTLGALNAGMAEKGQSIAATKCNSCHKQTDEKLVGPGWKGVTTRRTPVWIMNFITNPDPMINKDPEAQAMLEICLVRMPNQNLSDDEARNLLEYMRQIEGAK